MSAAEGKSQKNRGSQRQAAFLQFVSIAKRAAGHGVNSSK